MLKNHVITIFSNIIVTVQDSLLKYDEWVTLSKRLFKRPNQNVIATTAIATIAIIATTIISNALL